MKRSYASVALALAIVSASPHAPAQGPTDADIAKAKARALQRQGPACDTHPEFAAADFSLPLNAIRERRNGPFVLEALKKFGVRTIIRYYDWEDETLRCKTLRDDELDEILAAGLSVAVVFQHFNPEPLTFLDPRRGVIDARRSLDLAEANGQPFGSAIYFGVDGAEGEISKYVNEYRMSAGGPITEERKQQIVGKKNKRMSEGAFGRYLLNYEYFRENHGALFPGRDPLQITPADMLPHINKYFIAIKAEFDKASGGDPSRSYKLGVYGSGMVNLYVRKSNPSVTYFWLAQSVGWAQYAEYLGGKKWDIWQQYPTKCKSWYNDVEKRVVEFDFNMLMSGDIGQWNARRTGTRPLHRPLESCRLQGPWEGEGVRTPQKLDIGARQRDGFLRSPQPPSAPAPARSLPS